MKSIKQHIFEKLKINTNSSIPGIQDIVDDFYSEDSEKHDHLINVLYDELEFLGYKKHTTTNKIKDSSNWFIEIRKDNNPYMQIFHRLNANYFCYALFKCGDIVRRYVEPWVNMRANIDTKTSNVYEIPKGSEFEEICEEIQTNYR
jgi:hypothetical protein